MKLTIHLLLSLTWLFVLQVQEYMRLKAEREMAREKELKAHRMAREREIARLMALQQHQQDLQVRHIIYIFKCCMGLGLSKLLESF